MRQGLPPMRVALAAAAAAWIVALPATARAQPDDAGDVNDVPPAPVEAVPAAPPAGNVGPRHVLEGIVVRGNHKTEAWVVLRELGLAVGDVVAATDPRVEIARLRLLSLGYFLIVQFSLEKGSRRGGAVLVVTVEERGTIIINALYASRVRNRHPEARVLFLSGYAGEAFSAAASPEVAGTLLLAKPFTRIQLALEIREILEARGDASPRGASFRLRWRSFAATRRNSDRLHCIGPTRGGTRSHQW
jgi:hypothetical protein